MQDLLKSNLLNCVWICGLTILCFNACTTEPIRNASKKDQSKRLTPIVMNHPTISVGMEDFYQNFGTIDSIRTPAGILFRLSEDKKKLQLKKLSDEVIRLSDIKLYTNGEAKSVLLHLPSETPDTTGAIKPKLSFIRQDHKQLIVAIENGSNAVVPIWENRRIGYHKRRDKEEIFIPIPEQAMDLEKSIISVWCSNPAGMSDVLEISIEKGKVK